MTIHKLLGLESALGRTIEFSRYQNERGDVDSYNWILKVDDGAERAMSYTATKSDLIALAEAILNETNIPEPPS